MHMWETSIIPSLWCKNEHKAMIWKHLNRDNGERGWCKERFPLHFRVFGGVEMHVDEACVYGVMAVCSARFEGVLYISKRKKH